MVSHAAGEWARDDDGDGVREVHVNTMEGLWTGLRNFLRTFRGVNKKYLYQYVAIFEWGYNIKRVMPEFIRTMLGVPITTFSPHEPPPSLFPDSVNPPIRLRPKCVYEPRERLPTHPADWLAGLLPDAWFAAHPHARRKVAS